jgi:hypothetical protein
MQWTRQCAKQLRPSVLTLATMLLGASTLHTRMQLVWQQQPQHAMPSAFQATSRHVRLQVLAFTRQQAKGLKKLAERRQRLLAQGYNISTRPLAKLTGHHGGCRLARRVHTYLFVSLYARHWTWSRVGL